MSPSFETGAGLMEQPFAKARVLYFKSASEDVTTSGAGLQLFVGCSDVGGNYNRLLFYYIMPLPSRHPCWTWSKRQLVVHRDRTTDNRGPRTN